MKIKIQLNLGTTDTLGTGLLSIVEKLSVSQKYALKSHINNM